MQVYPSYLEPIRWGTREWHFAGVIGLEIGRETQVPEVIREVACFLGGKGLFSRIERPCQGALVIPWEGLLHSPRVVCSTERHC